MDATGSFARLVAGSGPAPVDEGALLIAARLDPSVRLEAERERLDRLAGSVGEPTLDGVRRLLFRDLGFTGDRVTYYDPRNSLLPAVVDRRRGIPVSLAVVALGVARRVNVPLDGVGMPGHFLLRDRVDPSVFIDPFARGAVLDRAACERRYHEVRGPEAPFDPAWLEPVPDRAILRRVLHNLRLVHEREGHGAELVAVLELLAVLPDGSVEEDRALATALTARGRFGEAAAVHDRLAGAGGDADDRARATRLRARLN